MEISSTNRSFLIRAWCARVSCRVRTFIGFAARSAADDQAREEAARDFGDAGPSAEAEIRNTEPTFSLAFDAMNPWERQADTASESRATRRTRSAQATGDDALSSATGS